MSYTREQIEQAHLRRRRIVAAVDDLAREQAAARATLTAAGRVPVQAGPDDGLALLLQVVTLWGDEPATGGDRD